MNRRTLLNALIAGLTIPLAPDPSGTCGPTQWPPSDFGGTVRCK